MKRTLVAIVVFVLGAIIMDSCAKPYGYYKSKDRPHRSHFHYRGAGKSY